MFPFRVETTFTLTDILGIMVMTPILGFVMFLLFHEYLSTDYKDIKIIVPVTLSETIGYC